MKKILIMTIGLIFLVISGLVAGAGIGLAEDLAKIKLNRAVIKIDTLTCRGCFPTINSGLANLEGYSGMGANLFRKLIAVDFKAPLTAQKISEKLIELGYPGKLETVDTVSEKESFVYLQSKRSGIRSGGGSCCSTGPELQQKKIKTDVRPTNGSCCTLPVPNQLDKSNQSTQDL